MRKKHLPANPDYGLRLKKIREIYEMTQKEFAANIKLSSSAISEIEAQANYPGYTFLAKLYENYNVSANYLLFDVGPPLLDDNKSLDDFDFEDKEESIRNILIEMEQSPLLTLSVVAYAENFLRTNRELIETDKAIRLREKQKKQESQGKNSIEKK